MTERAPTPKHVAARRPSEEEAARIEGMVATVLRAGVAASILLMLAGLVVGAVRHGDHLEDRSAWDAAATRQPHASGHELADVFAGLLAGDGEALIAAGLLLLIATPVVRVIVSIIAFLRWRDWAFVVLTSIVLTLLLISFALGKSG